MERIARMSSGLLLVCVPAILLACGGDDAPPPGMMGQDGGGPGVDGAPPPPPPAGTDRLEFVSMQNVTVAPLAQVELSVRYLHDDGTPIDQANLGFELVGTANGAMLSALTVTTAADGVATARLTGGAGPMDTFMVRVTPPTGAPIAFNVAVTGDTVGNIAVTMTYAGRAVLDTFEPLLYRARPCNTIDPVRPPTADRAAAPVMRVTDPTGFPGIAVGTDWTVAVVGKMGGMPRAIGCAASIAVTAGTTTNVTIALEETAMRFDGVWDLDNHFDFGGFLPPSVENAVDIVAEIADDDDVDGNPATMDYGQDPGAFLLDFIMRQTCHWECVSGEGYSSCSELNHPIGDLTALYTRNFMSWDGAQSRFFGGCGGWETAAGPAQDLINEQVNAVVPTGVTMIAEIASDLAQAFTRAHIYSELTISPPMGNQAQLMHRLVRMEVPLHDLDGRVTSYEVALDDVGLTSVRTSAVATVADEMLTIPPHSFMLDFGALAQYIYLHGVLPLLGYTDSAEMLRDWIDCGAVADGLVSLIGTGFLDRADYFDYCNAGIDAAGAALDTSLEGTLGDATLTLQGTAIGTMPDAANIAQRLEMGAWSATLVEVSSTGMATGTFTGVRRP